MKMMKVEIEGMNQYAIQCVLVSQASHLLQLPIFHWLLGYLLTLAY